MPFEVGSKEGAIPAGKYVATLENVELTVITSQYGTRETRKWHFLLNVEGELVPLSALSSMNTAAGSKTYTFLEALLRRPLRAGEKLDDPIGQRVYVNVVPNQKGYSTVASLEPYSEPEQVVAGVPR